MSIFRRLRSALVRRTSEYRNLQLHLRSIETERDELSGHCRRLDAELADGHRREEDLQRLCHDLGQATNFLDRERKILREVWYRQNPPEAPAAGEAGLLQRMQHEWDGRASLSALYYTNTAQANWNLADYFASGEKNVEEHILSDLENICQGRHPAGMRVLEIGCGAGRITRALAGFFGEVHAVDISGEMIARARENLAGVPNAFFHQNNGRDLRDLAGPFDFAFSYIVFQHIPSKDVIESYIGEVVRLLKPGALFKFQVMGVPLQHYHETETWFGADFSVDGLREIAARRGFEARYFEGEGTQYLWAWLFKPEAPSATS